MILKKELAKMEEDLERKQKAVAKIAVDYKNQELDGGKKAVERETEIGNNGKSLKDLKKEVYQLATSIAEHRHMIDQAENVEKVMSQSFGRDSLPE